MFNDELDMLQKWEQLAYDWIFFGKIRLSDIPQELRKYNSVLHSSALRYARERNLANRYVEELNVLLEDAVILEKQDKYASEDLYRLLFNSMYFGENYFKGEKSFDEFIQKQKDNPSLNWESGGI